MRSLLLNTSPVLLHGPAVRDRRQTTRLAAPSRAMVLLLFALLQLLCTECGARTIFAAPALARMGVTAPSAAVADPPAAQAHEMLYIHIGPESADDHRYTYHWQVLKQALDKTSAKYGPYRIRPADFMSEERQAFELRRQSGKLTVLLRGDTMEYDKAFECVRIPVDKGLLGYRVFLIRSEDQPRLTRATTLEELRNFTIGQGSGWKDIEILRANGLKVMAGDDYAGLFAMLANRRFDVFSRGVEEVVDEYAQHKQQFPSLAIENNVMLYYPIARYFWFSRSDQGHKLAERVREGMAVMIEDGSFDRLFETAHKDLFERLHLTERTLLVLHNPLAMPQAPLNDSRYWYLPLKRARGSAASSP